MISLAVLKKTQVMMAALLWVEGMDKAMEEHNEDKQEEIVMLETVQ